ncbi:MAG TPA: TonB-dependent receptor, partial [Rheinheimera sp.]|nr:TonB-dependent receptor [Rheinheimera sp.]
WDDNGAAANLDFRNYQLTRETNSAALKFEYAPDSDSKYTLASLYTEFLDHELRNQFIFDLAAGKGERGISSGSVVGVPMTAMYQDGDYENSTWVNTLSGEHSKGDWRWNWAVNYTETESLIDLPIFRRSQINPAEFHSLDYDMSNPQAPQLQLYGTMLTAQGLARGEAVSALNQDGFGFDGLILYRGVSTTDALTFKLDADHSWQHGRADAKLAFGVQYDQRDAASPGSSSPFIYIGPLAQAAGLTFTPDAFNTATAWDTDQHYGFSVNYYDNVGARRQIDQTLAGLTAAGLVDPDSFVTPDSGYQVTEDILSAYLMNTWTWDKHQLLVGVRAEQVNLSSAGFISTGDGVQAVDRKRDTTELFPSIHWNVDLTEDLKFRLAGVTGSSRPSFSEVRAGASVSDAEQAISGGNPYLESETARGIDSSLEWYFADASLAAVNLFYRDLEDVLFSSVTTVGDDRFNTDGVDRSGYEYSTKLNGGSGHFSGIELTYIQPWDFLPDSLRGFGMQFNYALLDSEFTTPDGRKVALPGTSDKVMNTSFFYENHGWSVRLNYQWRDAWLDDISFEATGDIYWQDTARLDLSLRYQLSESMSVYADLNNLTDEMGVRYRGDASKPVEVEGFGRRFLAGVKISF